LGEKQSWEGMRNEFETKNVSFSIELLKMHSI